MSAFNTGALHPLANPLSSAGAPAEKRMYEPSMEEILASIRRIIADDQSLPGRGGAERDPAERPPVAAPTELRRTSAPEPVEPPRHEPGAEPRLDRAPFPILPEPALGLAPTHGATNEGLETAAVPDAEPRAAPLAHGTVAAPQYATPDYAAPDHVSDRGAPAPPEEPLPDLMSRAAAHDEAFEPEQVAPLHAAVPEPESAAEPEAPPASPAVAPSLFSAATDSSVAAAFNMLAASRLADNSDELMNLVREMIRPLLRNWLDDNLPSMVERMVRAEIERVARGGR